MADENAVVRPAPADPYPGARAISPVAAALGKNAVKLSVRIAGDNLVSSCVFAYTLLDDKGKLVASGSAVIKGLDYENWTGDNDTPYTFTAKTIGVTLI